MASKKISEKTTLSKAAFIRSLPATMPVKEVIAEAKKNDLSISNAYVSWTRCQAKKKATRAAARRAANGSRNTAVPRPSASFAEDLPMARSR